MNKDKLQVGDLVTLWSGVRCPGRLTTACGEGIGLVVSVSTIRTAKVYWFKSGYVGSHSIKSINKLEIPNE